MVSRRTWILVTGGGDFGRMACNRGRRHGCAGRSVTLACYIQLMSTVSGTLHCTFPLRRPPRLHFNSTVHFPMSPSPVTYPLCCVPVTHYTVYFHYVAIWNVSKPQQLHHIISYSILKQIANVLTYSCSWTRDRSQISHSFHHSTESSSSNIHICITNVSECFKTRTTSTCQIIRNSQANHKIMDIFVFFDT